MEQYEQCKSTNFQLVMHLGLVSTQITALFKLLCAMNSSNPGYHLLAMLDAYAVIGTRVSSWLAWWDLSMELGIHIAKVCSCAVPYIHVEQW